MKREFTVTMPFTGIATRTIEAESQEEAVQSFLDTSSFCFNGNPKEGDAEVLEIMFCEQIVTGNIFHGIRNEVDVEDNGEIEED